MRILGIETSCDETAVCLIEAKGAFPGRAGRPSFSWTTLGNALLSQASLHAEFGGVFPNLAKREHAKNLVPLTADMLRQAGIQAVRHGDISAYMPQLRTLLAREPELLEHLPPFLRRHERPDIDALAVTCGPGLEPALWVGINFAKALSYVWNIPLVAVNHMEGHIVMPMMEIVSPSSGKLAEFEFPLLALLISGGHTELVLANALSEYKVIGQTRDDAAGEAFDKVARLLGLEYPGGPEISRLAAESRRAGIPLHTQTLPRPMLREDNFDFSFSGLKTAVRRLVEGKEVSDEDRMGLAREFEDAVTEVLVAKTLRAAEEFGANAVLLGGGVSANVHIRTELGRKLQAVSCKLLICPPELATDNALMIALAGYFRALKGEFTAPEDLVAKGNLPL